MIEVDVVSQTNGLHWTKTVPLFEAEEKREENRKDIEDKEEKIEWSYECIGVDRFGVLSKGRYQFHLWTPFRRVWRHPLDPDPETRGIPQCGDKNGDEVEDKVEGQVEDNTIGVANHRVWGRDLRDRNLDHRVRAHGDKDRGVGEHQTAT